MCREKEKESAIHVTQRHHLIQVTLFGIIKEREKERKESLVRNKDWRFSALMRLLGVI
jgi:hypothetical protein